MFPRHPNLMPAYFDDDPAAAELGTSYVRKLLYSREGANVAIITSGNYPVLGSWIVDGTPRGLSIREDENPITGNHSRFLPHAIV